MLNCVLQNRPLINNILANFFSSYLGINLDLSSLCLDDNNNFNLELNNIEAHPSMINNILLDKSNIKITNANIGKLNLQFNLNEFSISISKIKIVIMPIKNKIIEKENNENIQNLENKNEKNSNSQKEKKDKSLIDKIIDYILERITITISKIDIYILNYETKDLNILYANPCLSIHVPYIKYKNGICKDIKSKENQIPKNYWDNKHLYISNIILRVSKIFNKNNEKKFFEIEDYETIMTFNNENGINFYTNYDNGINCDIGDLQFIINPLQFELIKNIFECYLDYFSDNDDEKKKNFNKINNNKVIESENKNNSNQELPFNINFNMNSFSIILLENNYKEIPKLNNFKVETLKNHFCYFEDNYFLFLISNIKAKIKNDMSIDFSIEKVNLSYIEYIKKSNYTKEELNKLKEVDSVKKSEYYEPLESLIVNEDEIFRSIDEGNSNINEKWLLYKFEFFENEILVLNEMNVQYKKNIKVNVKDINVGIHPSYLFKGLKLAYNNMILINEIFFYNNNLIKSNNSINENLNINNGYSENNNDINVNENLDNNENISVNSKDDKKEIYEKKNEEGFEFEFNINLFLVKIYSFKQEEEFCNTINRFFPEFYYECIFYMESRKNDKKYRLEYLTGRDDLVLTFLNIKLSSNKNNQINLTFDKYKIFFSDNIIAYSDYPFKLSMQNSDISITFYLNIDLNFKLINNIMMYSNLWNYSFMIFKIFFERMTYNFSKGKKDIYEMYHGKKKIEKKNTIIKNKKEESSLLIKVNIPKIDINCKIHIEEDLNPHIIINDITLNYLMKEKTQNICFKLSKISSEKMDLIILDLTSDINMETNIIDNNNNNIVNKEQTIIIKPEIILENYIINYMKYQNLLKSKKPKKKNEIKLFVNLNYFSVNTIEGILFANDFYNEYMESESYSSIFLTKNADFSINNNNTSLSTRLTSFDNISVENLKPKEENSTNINYKISINQIKFIINDNNSDKKNKALNFEFNDLTIKENSIFLKNSQIYIEYFYKKSQKVIANLGKINEFQIDIINQPNNKLDININLTELSFGFCKDSLNYIEELCFYFINLSSKIFITEKLNSVSSLMKSNYSSLNSTCKSEKRILDKTLNIEKKKNKLEINDSYLKNSMGSKYLNENSTSNSIKPQDIKFQKNINCNHLNLNIKTITLSIYDGKDFENEIDVDLENFNDENVENNNNDNLNIMENLKIENNITNDFEVLEPSQFKQKTQRNYLNYITLSISEINFNLNFETTLSYQFIFSIEIIEIIDHIDDSDFKRLYTRADIHENENKNIPCMLINVDISNSHNEISVGKYCDYNVNCTIKFAPMQLMLHQATLYFAINFIIGKDNKDIIKYNFDSFNYHIFKKNIVDLTQVTFLDNTLTEQSMSMITNYNSNKNFIYITNFSIDNFIIYITYQALDYSFTYDNITIPLPSLQNYPFNFKILPYSGFVSIEDFADFFVKDFINQLSAYQLVVDFFKSLSFTRPLVNLFSDFFYIFISPYYSYKKKEGIFTGLLFGVKKFLFSFLSQNIFLTEKTIRTVTTFVGITKNNKIGKGSFYEKYVISDENKKFYDYFYKN